MMVVAARRNERGLAPVTLCQGEAQHAAVEAQRTLKIGHFQVHMADTNFRINRFHQSTRDGRVTLPARQEAGEISNCLAEHAEEVCCLWHGIAPPAVFRGGRGGTKRHSRSRAPSRLTATLKP